MESRKPHPVEPIKPRIAGDLSPNEIATLIQSKCKAFPSKARAKAKHYVFFTPHAWDSFVASVNYGKWVAENELESQYFLEGYFFIDRHDVSSTVVTNIITPYSAAQGKSSAQLYSESFNAYKIINQKEEELTKYASSGKDLDAKCMINPFCTDYGPPIRVGFGHTHPNLSCFFSSVDKTSIFAAPGEPWVTMVADPRKKELLAAVGTQMEVSPIIIFHQTFDETHENDARVSTLAIEQSQANETRSFREDFVEFLMFISDQLRSGASVKMKMSGELPGKLDFKGTVFMPKAKKKNQRR